MTNKTVRQFLEMLYGKGCMFQKAHIPSLIQQLKDRDFETYEDYLKRVSEHLKQRKINLLEKNMTLHHLKHRSEGGLTTVENGAIMSELAHRYIHQIPRDKEEIINNMIRQYKQDCQIRGRFITS